MLENANLVAVMLDTEGSITFINDFVLHLTGWKREEVIGKSWFDVFIPPEQREEIEQFFHRSIVQGKVEIHSENDMVTRWDERRTISFNNELLYDLQGNIIGSASIGEDMTEERRKAEEISESRKQVLDILESITDGFFALDNDWRFTYVNRRAAQLLERRREELLFKNGWNEFPEAVGTTFYKEFYRAKGEMVSVSFEEFYPPLDKWFEVRAYPYENGLSVYFTDITERKRVQESLRESEERFRVTFEQAAVGIAHADLDGTFIRINQKFADIVGYTKEELIKKTFIDITYPGDVRKDVDQALQLLGGRINTYSMEKRYIKKDGSLIWVNLTASLVRDEEEEPQYFISVIEDISERKRTEEERERLADRMRLLLESTDEGIYGLDEEGKCIIFNRAASEITGYAPEEVLGKELHNLIHHTKKDGSLYPADECPVIRAFKAGQGVRLDTEIFWRKDGTSFPVELSSNPIIEEGMIKGAVVTFVDITKRKRREAEREELANRIQLLLQSTDQGIFGFDKEGDLTFINRAASEMIGYTAEEALGKNSHLLFHYSYSDGTPYPTEKCHIYNATKTGRGVRIDTEVFWRKDGTSFPVEYSSYPIIENGEVKGAVVAFTDITERKKLEEERRRAKELSDAINSIDRALSSTLDFEKIMQIVVNASATTLGVDAASIHLREDGHWVLKYSYGLPSQVAGTRFTDEEIKASVLAAETRRPVVGNDAYNDQRVSRETMEKYGIRSFLITPLSVREEIIGVLIYSYHKAPIAFTDAQIEFAEKLAAAASVALENSRLYESLRRSEENLRRRARDLEMLNHLSSVLSQTLNLDMMLNAAIDSVMDILEADGAAIYMLDEENRVLKMVVSKGLSEHFIKSSLEVPIGERLTGTIAKAGEPLVIEDLAAYPELEASIVYETFTSFIGVPIKSRGKVIGAFPLGSRQRGKFTQIDKTLLEAIGNELGVAIENARLYELERSIADTLQEALLTMPEHIDHLEYSYLYRSATEVARVGGDFYDVFELEHGKVGILIGDVSGKGLKAATLTSVVRNTIRAYAFERYTPAEVMAKTNEILRAVSGPAMFVTVFFGILEEKTKELVYCSAGHPPAIIITKTGMIELLDVHSPVIGAFAGFKYVDATATVEDSDVLFLYTDGLIEARREDEFFRQDRLIDFIKGLRRVSPKDLPQIMFNEVMKFTGGRLADDIALMAISLARR
jgi:PAS domain S-box-containing protein